MRRLFEKGKTRLVFKMFFFFISYYIGGWVQSFGPVVGGVLTDSYVSSWVRIQGLTLFLSIHSCLFLFMPLLH